MITNDNTVLDIFRQKKILTLPELSGYLGCSSRTAQRRLSAWKTYTSYNHNGQYYTLPDVPKFNQHQLWHYKGIFFSKRKTLKNTIQELINESQAGLNVLELHEILRMRVDEFLSKNVTHENTCQREKHKGIYIYYSKEPSIAQIQKQKRHQLFSCVVESKLPTEADSVIILVELIKHPNDTVEQLFSRTKYRGIRVPCNKIRNLLEYHGLLKKTLE